MDPNAILDALRELVKINKRWRATSTSDEDEFSDLFDELDEWLSKGGFLPDAWRANGRLVTQARI